MNSSLASYALLIGLIILLTYLPESLSTTATPEQNVPQTCNMCCHGPPGKPGIPGVPGTSGAFGPVGPPGIKGDKGEFVLGEPGNKGSKGNKGSDGSPGNQGPHGQIGPRGPKGNTGLKGEKGEPGLQVAPQVRKSAFTAARTTHVQMTESIILFTTMQINAGEDFDKNTGKFTCRISGFYYFMFNFLLYSDYTSLIKMKLNDRVLTMVHRTRPTGHDQFSSGITVQLDVGDQVWLANEGRVYCSSSLPLTFTGFLI